MEKALEIFNIIWEAFASVDTVVGFFVTSLAVERLFKISKVQKKYATFIKVSILITILAFRIIYICSTYKDDQANIQSQDIEATTEVTAPTIDPSVEPTVEPTIAPTVEPTVESTVESTVAPTVEPTVEPTTEATTDTLDDVEFSVTGQAQSELGICPFLMWIYAETSTPATTVTIRSSLGGGTFNMHSTDSYDWEFQAEFYIAGEHTITIEATDTNGNKAYSSITITADSPSPNR